MGLFGGGEAPGTPRVARLGGYWDLLSNILGTGLGIYGSFDLQRAQNEARAANEEAYGEGQDLLSGLRDRTLGTYDDISQQALDDMLRYAQYGREQYAPIVGGYGDLAQSIGGAYRGLTGDLNRDYAGLQRDLYPRYGERTATAGSEGGRITENLRSGYGDLGNLYDERTARNLASLEGLGEQEEADIRRGYGSLEQTALADLAQRGLGASTINTGTRQGVAREQTDALGRLNERLRRERIGLDTALSGEALAARERGLGAGTATEASMLDRYLAASGDELGARTALGLEAPRMRERVGQNAINAGTLGQQAYLGAQERAYGMDLGNYRDIIDQQRTLGLGRMGYDIDLTNNMANWIQAAERAYPDSNPWLNIAGMLGGAVGPSPQYPTGTDWTSVFGPALGGVGAGLGSAIPLSLLLSSGGGGAAAAGGGAAALGSTFLPMVAAKGPFCIDGSAKIDTATGPKALADVQVGDDVLSSDGTFSKVVDKDYGLSQRPEDFVRITDGEKSLIVTVDHVVCGVPAGQWASAVKVAAVPCGDIRLENDEGYYANDFPVMSMMSVYAYADTN